MCARSSNRRDKAGLEKIAAALGISPSTVSRALRPETAHLVQADRRRQILEMADRQRFSPNLGARILRSGTSAILTVVVPFDENIFLSEFYGRFLAGTMHAAACRGWNVQIRTLKRTPETDLRESLQQIGLDSSGVIYLAERLSLEDVEQVRGFHRPLVLTKGALPREVDLPRLGLPIVGVDNYNGARSAVSLLLQLGHRRLGLLLGPERSRDGYERRLGYLDALATAGIAVPAEWIVEGQFTVESGRERTKALLERRERPTALCCASDQIAYGAIGAIHAAGLRCPDDFSVVGFDDGFWATMCQPTLTTIRQPLADLAERAVAAIVEASQAATRGPPRVTADMPTSLVIRESTRAIVAV